jgi:hypothetical protein
VIDKSAEPVPGVGIGRGSANRTPVDRPARRTALVPLPDLAVQTHPSRRLQQCPHRTDRRIQPVTQQSDTDDRQHHTPNGAPTSRSAVTTLTHDLTKPSQSRTRAPALGLFRERATGVLLEFGRTLDACSYSARNWARCDAGSNSKIAAGSRGPSGSKNATVTRSIYSAPDKA